MVAGTEDDQQHKRAFVWQRGRLIRLGALPGDSNSEIVAINDRGQVVGFSYRDSPYSGAHAFLWEKGRIRGLGSFRPADINEHGHVVGTAFRGLARAVLWKGGRLRNLLPLRSGSASEGAALNDAGQVVGAWSKSGNAAGYFPDVTKAVAFLWQNGRMRSLGTLPGRTGSLAVDVNERGQVVGSMTTVAGPWGGAFVWQQGKMSAIHRDSLWHPVAINDRGQVALNRANDWALWLSGKIRRRGPGEVEWLDERGTVAIADDSDTIPRISVNGTTTRLPLLPGDTGGAATSLNERDQVVGFSCTFEVRGDKDKVWHCRVALWIRP
jgi:probable HAF family extracellular repeat protein